VPAAIRGERPGKVHDGVIILSLGIHLEISHRSYQRGGERERERERERELYQEGEKRKCRSHPGRLFGATKTLSRAGSSRERARSLRDLSRNNLPLADAIADDSRFLKGPQ